MHVRGYQIVSFEFRRELFFFQTARQVFLDPSPVSDSSGSFRMSSEIGFYLLKKKKIIPACIPKPSGQITKSGEKNDNSTLLYRKLNRRKRMRKEVGRILPDVPGRADNKSLSYRQLIRRVVTRTC